VRHAGWSAVDLTVKRRRGSRPHREGVTTHHCTMKGFARGISMACIVLLLLSVSERFALAQTQQQKQTQSSQQPKPGAGQQSVADPEAGAASRQTWKVRCDKDKAGHCRAERTLLSQNAKRPIVTVSLGVAADTKQPNMQIRLPLGIYLPAGASVQIGQEAARPLMLERCGVSGCYGRYDIAATDVAAMLKGADIMIRAENRDHTPLQYLVRSEGFPEAYAKVK
jgi:invasion protein IalB